jgi:ribose transport system substrate-binding protein
MRYVKALALLLGAAVVMAGCGSSSDSSANATGSSGSGGGAGDGIPAAIAAAKAETSPWTADQTKLPTTGPKAAKGKFLIAVSCGISIEGCRAISQGHVEAAKALGWKTQLIDGKGAAQGWSSAIQSAIQLKPDVIALGAIDPNAVSDDLAAANKAGIKVVATTGTTEKGAPSVDFSNGLEGISTPIGKDSADYALGQSGKKADALVLYYPEFAASLVRRDAFVAEYKKLCPSCQYKTLPVKIAEWGTTLPARLQATLQQNPNINWIFSPADETAVDGANAIQAAGLTGKVKVVGGNGEKQSYQRVASDPGYAAVVATSYFLASYEAVDAANRLVQGEQPAPLITQANRLMDKSNVSTVPKGQYWSADFDFQAAYKKLWGV